MYFWNPVKQNNTLNGAEKTEALQHSKYDYVRNWPYLELLSIIRTDYPKYTALEYRTLTRQKFTGFVFTDYYLSSFHHWLLKPEKQKREEMRWEEAHYTV